MRTMYLSILLTLLLLSFGSSNVYCGVEVKPKITITGTVVDESNEPIIGSSVYLKSGSNKVGCVTDFDGKFALSIVPQGGTFGVTVSYVGYKTLNRSFFVDALDNSKGTIKVRMLEDKRKNKNKNSSIIAQDFSDDAILKSMGFINAAKQGIAKSKYQKTPQQLCKEGNKYYNGTDGVTKDYAKALELYLQAAEQGYSWAQTRVGYMYDLGMGTPEDNVKALSWYTKAAEQGDLIAQSNLGFLYENGEGVTRDYALAALWYQKAAEQHNARAQANLAELYFFGHGVPQDNSQAFIWALRAGGQGNSKGQFRLGYLYETGKGVTQNYKLAREWYLKAAEQGNTAAMINLGVFYNNGKGVKKNSSEALAWYNNAVDNGSTKAKEYAKGLTSKGVKPATTTTGATMDLPTLLNTCLPKIEIATTSTPKAAVPTTNTSAAASASASTSPHVDYSKMTPEQLCNEASKYYNGTNGVTQNYKKAFEIYEQAAKKGSARAQYYLGEIYEDGNGTEKDRIVAYQWYKKAADNGDAIACNRLGNLFYSGETVPQDYSTAFSWFKQSAEKGYKWGQFNFGNMYYNGKGCKQDYEKAIAWYQKAAEQNVPNALNKLGLCYDNGYGVPEDNVKAVEYFKKAAELGYDWGQYNLGYMYYNGEGCEKDYKQAVYWFQKAASKKMPEAYNQIGICYGNGGYGISVDKAKAFDNYKKSAEMGYHWGQYNLANYYYNGEGCKKDYTQAVVWFQKAADQNIPEAQNELGICYDKGYGVQKDEAKALVFFKKAAEQGYDWGQYNLATKYYNGTGCEKDSVKAAYWFEKAASQGLVDAQTLLAWGYYNGIVVKKDIKKALEWIEKAAQSGNAEAQCDAGFCLSEDTPYKDYKKAFEWTQIAADQGYATALNNLGWFYEHGWGTSKDLTKAVEIYKKAADNDVPSGLANLGRMYENGYGGLPVDYGKAMELYLKAADKKSYKAMRNIAKMYEKGLGVEKNLAQAVIWYSKADEGGDKEAKSRLAEFNQRLSGMPVAASSNASVLQPQATISQNNIPLLPETPKRIALIIGNDDYGTQRLDNPVKDAMALNAVLQLLGFETNAYMNLDKEETERLVAEFTEKASNYDMALFYYAGHAIQSKGVNYLVPARPEPVLNAADIKRKYVDLPFIVNSMIDAEAKRNIIILDACRDTPDFIGVKTRGEKNGLAYITEPERFLVAYSTQAGMTAADGKGMEHSPYMTVLLEQLKVPGLNVDQLFVRVRDNVQELTHNEQRPFFKNNLSESPREKFYFNRGK